MKRTMNSVACVTGRHETAEFVLPGHPDKLCDAVADGIIDWHRNLGNDLQFGLEVACVFDRVFVTGRIANPIDRVRLVFPHHRDRLVRETYASAGYGVDAAGYLWGPLPENLKIDWALCLGEFEKGERELRHLSDDQAICVGYALRSPKTDYLPPAHWLARRIGRELARLRLEQGAGQIGPDGKVIVHGTRTGRGGEFRPELVSVSLNHHEQSDWLVLRRVVEDAVETACAGMALPEIEMNGAGMFVAGGPNGDNGLSGKKLVVDAYGPGVPIGGGAWSGKDFFKVDRLGGMAARRLALESLLASDADEALVTLIYLPGGDRPARIDLLLDGEPSTRIVVPAKFGALESRVLHGLFAPASTRAVDLARWGHQQPGMPWELELSVSGVANIEAIPCRNGDPMGTPAELCRAQDEAAKEREDGRTSHEPSRPFGAAVDRGPALPQAHAMSQHARRLGTDSPRRDLAPIAGDAKQHR